jgi:Ca2+-binding RTX toxin-like protein
MSITASSRVTTLAAIGDLTARNVATGALPDGRVAVAWNNDTSQHLSILATDGTLITTYTLASAAEPATTQGIELAVLPDGTVGVVWSVNTDTVPTLFMRSLDPSGQLSPLRDFGLAISSADLLGRNTLAIQPDGGGFVVMLGPVDPPDGGTGSPTAVVRRVDATGETVAGPTAVLPGRGDPSVAVLPDGRLIVVTEGAAGGDIEMVVLNADGTTAAGPVTVNATTAGTQGNPAVVLLADGRFVVTWDDSGGSASDPCEIRGQLFTAGGEKVGPEFLVNTTVPGRQVNPALVALSDGGFVVAWTDLSGGEALRMRAFHGNGTPRSDEVTVQTGGLNGSNIADLSELPDGRIVVAWFYDVDETVRTRIYDPRIVPADDTVGGGPGDDSYTVDSAGDVILEAPNAGTDLIRTALPYLSLASFPNIENLIGTSDDEQSLTGNGLANAITGADGDDVLKGAAGSDTLLGGLGDDVLVGGAGNDLLGGGAGEDVMRGGAGDDTYQVDSLADVVKEAAGGGTDTVVTSLASYSLASLPEVENIVSTSTVGAQLTGNDRNNVLTGTGLGDGLSGREGDDTLIGDAGDDTLDGGAGLDSLAGGTGNDLYRVDHAGDVVVELAGGGSDRVIASVDWTLGAETEWLSLAGTAALNGTGNALDNKLEGNAGANRLEGAGGNDTLTGGAGADTLTGGAGNDLYRVDAAGDVITELPGEGHDRVIASVDWTLGAEIEWLSLSGTAALNGTGNELDNTLEGNAGANRLEGAGGKDRLIGGDGADTLDGGAGADRLIGGAGEDAFCFAALPAAGEHDQVVGFVSGVDRLLVSAGGFGGGLVEGGAVLLVAAAVPSAAGAPGAVFLYDTDNGRLSFDADGQGSGRAVLVAILNGAPALSAADLQILA